MGHPVLKKLWVTLRSAGVGIVATGVDLLALGLLTSWGGLDPRLASAPALTLGVIVQFVGNKLFAFGDRSERWVRQGIEFLAVEALGFTANLALFHLVVSHSALPVLPVRLLTTSFVYFAICLPLWSRIFTTAEPSHD